MNLESLGKGISVKRNVVTAEHLGSPTSCFSLALAFGHS